MHYSDAPISVPRLILILAGLSALTPLSVDMYLPAIPTMAENFGVAVAQVEISVSLFLLGLGSGQLIGGPLSDKYGRRRIVFTGLLLFLAGTLGIVLSQAVGQLWLFRIIQALGGGIAVVNSSAIVRDVSSGAQSARHQSRISTVMMTAPMLAPLIGMVVLHLLHWRAIFGFLFVYGVLQAYLIYRFLPETSMPSALKISFWRRYWLIFSHRRALAYIFAVAGGYGGLFAFVAGSPSLYIGYFGVSTVVYPFLFGFNIVLLLVCNQLNIRLLHRYRPQQLFPIIQLVQLAASVLLLAYVALTDAPQLLVVVLFIALFMGVHGSMVANGTASTTDFFAHNAATAAAVIGAVGFLVGGLGGLAVGLLADGSAMPVATVMCGMSIIGTLLRLSLKGRVSDGETTV